MPTFPFYTGPKQGAIENILGTVGGIQSLQRQNQDTQEALANQQESAARYGNEHTLIPRTGPGGFVNGYNPNTAVIKNNLSHVEGMLPNGFSPPTNQPETTTTPQAAPQAATPGPSYPTQTPMGILDAEGIRTAASPQQGPGDPKAILSDPKINHEIAKGLVQIPKNPGDIVNQGDTESPTRFTQKQEVSSEDATIPVNVPSQWIPDPNMYTHMMGASTSQKNVDFDPPISVGILRAMGPEGAKIADALERQNIGQLPRSVVGNFMTGNYGLEKAKVGVFGGGVGRVGQFLDGLRNGTVSMGDVSSRLGQLTKGETQALENATRVGQADARIRQSGDRLAFNQLQSLKKDLDLGSMPITSAIGSANATLDAAKRVDGIFQQFPDFNIPEAQTAEAAMAVARMISGGGRTAQAQINELIPHGMQGDYEKVLGWIQSNPNGLEQRAAMRLLHETELREQSINKGIVDGYINKKLGGYSAFAKNHPQEYNDIVSGMGVDPWNDPNRGGRGNPPANNPSPNAMPPSHAPQSHAPQGQGDYESDRQKYLRALDDPKQVDPLRRTEAYGAFDAALRKKYGQGKGIRGQ